MGDWQPIETAPKDGTAILLCWAVNADGKPIDWRTDPTTAGVFVQVAAWWEGDNDWIVYCSMVREPSLHFKPTHWMSLPPPPSAPDAAREAAPQGETIDPTDPGYNVEVLREHVRHLERRIRELHAERNAGVPGTGGGQSNG